MSSLRTRVSGLLLKSSFFFGNSEVNNNEKTIKSWTFISSENKQNKSSSFPNVVLPVLRRKSISINKARSLDWEMGLNGETIILRRIKVGRGG